MEIKDNDKYDKLRTLIKDSNNRVAPFLGNLKGLELERAEKEWRKSHISDLLEIRKYSSDNNLFYSDCCIKVYKNHYSHRLNQFLAKNYDSIEQDFIEIEIERISTGNTYRFQEAYEIHKYSHKRILEFLEDRLDSIDLKSKKVDSFTPFKAVQSFEILGILEFLKDTKGMSFQNQAKFISHIIDKSEANIIKEISNRRNNYSPLSRKKNYDKLKSWIDLDLLEK